MKTSTKRSSFKVKRAKLDTTIAGLAFLPVKADNVYLSVLEWLKAGAPDMAYVFDNVDTLKVCKIPICDAVHIKGIYLRTAPKKPRKAVVVIVPHVIRELRQGTTKVTLDIVQASNTQEHHNMSY